MTDAKIPQRDLFFALCCAVASVVLSSVTLILGTIPLHAWYRRQGKVSYIAGVSLIAGIAFFQGWNTFLLPYLSLSALILVFNEIDRRYKYWSLSFKGLLTVAATSALIFAVFGLVSSSMGFTLESLLEKPLNQFVEQVETLSESKGAAVLEIKPKEILLQVPSGVAIALIFSLFLALLSELRWSSFFSTEAQPSEYTIRRSAEFLNFRVPDVFIWLMIASLLLSFVKMSLPESIKFSALNLLNVLLVVYFLQGLSVATVFFKTYKVGRLWRSIMYVLFVLQMFLFVSCIGVVDYWFDFRAKLLKKVLDTKIKNKGGLK